MHPNANCDPSLFAVFLTVILPCGVTNWVLVLGGFVCMRIFMMRLCCGRGQLWYLRSSSPRILNGRVPLGKET